MKKKYQFIIEGTGANGQTWTATGNIECEFNEVFDLAMRDAFMQLTSGKAVYGKPGVGCNGPYDVTSVVIKQTERARDV